MTVAPFYSLEIDINCDLETITNEEEALEWANRFLPDLDALLRRHARGQTIHIGLKLDHSILEYNYVDGVDRKEEQEQAADNFVARVGSALEKIKEQEAFERQGE